MTILLNGEPHELTGPMSVQALLDHVGVDARLVAVEHNRVVVKRERYHDAIINEGAEVEIVSFVGGGVGPRRARRSNRPIRTGLLVLVMLAITAASVGRAQQTATTEETALVAQGWNLLAQGKAGEAAAHASALLGRYPRSTAVLTLAVETETARAGSIAGLDVYERWLGARKLDDAYVLRRVALAFLKEVMRAKPTSVARMDALQGLALEGDQDAQAELQAQAQTGAFDATQALAGAGNVGAVNALIARLKSPLGGKDKTIEALIKSRSPNAVAPLMELLDDARADPYLRVAAADGLGQLGAKQAIPKLKMMLNDSLGFVKQAAAGALYRLDDMSGIAVLNLALGSEVPAVRLSALKKMDSKPDAAWLNAVRSLTGTPEPTDRIDVARLLAPYEPELARSILDQLRQDGNINIREEAATVLSQEVATDFATLRMILRASDDRSRVRAAARILLLTR